MSDQLLTLDESTASLTSTSIARPETNSARTPVLANSSAPFSATELDAARKSNHSTSAKLPSELQKLSGVLNNDELSVLARVANQTTSHSEIPESSKLEVLRIIQAIAKDDLRAQSLDITNPSIQSVALALANRVFDQERGAVLAQLIAQSAIEPAHIQSRDPATTTSYQNESLQEQHQQLLKAPATEVSGTKETPRTWGSFFSGAWNATVSAVSNPENWKMVGTALTHGAHAAGSYVVECCTDPKKFLQAAKAVAHFGYDLVKSLGIIDIGYGTFKAVEGMFRAGIGQIQFSGSLLANGFQFLTGQQSFSELTQNVKKSFSDSFGEAFNCFKESTYAVKGLITAVGEATGLADAARCVYYLSKGDYANAALYGAIATASIGMFVASGGLSSVGVAAAKLGLTQLAKATLTKVAAEGMEQIAKETAKEVFEKIVVNAGTSALKESGITATESAVKIAGEKALTQAVERNTSKILTQGINELTQSVKEKGIKALVGKEAEKAVGEIFEKHAYQSTKELLSDLNVYKHVKESCHELLKTIDARNLAGLEKKLISSGVSEDAAKATAQQLRKALKRGVNDEEMIEILSKNITEEISSQIIKRTEESFKSTFRAALSGETPLGMSDDLAKAVRGLQSEMKERFIILNKQEIDDLVEAGFDGCKRGIKRATREVVELAVRDAFDEFRKTNRRLLPTLAFNLGVDVSQKMTQENAKGVDGESKQSSLMTKNQDHRKPHPRKIQSILTEDNTLLDKTTKVSEVTTTGS